MSSKSKKKRHPYLHGGTYEGTDALVVEVLRLLHEAWDAVAIPSPYDVGYSEENDEDGEVYAIYGNKDWKRINPPDVSGNFACMTLMTTDIAKSYYLGTYMLRILEGHLEKNIKYDLADSIDIVLHNIIGRGNLMKVFRSRSIEFWSRVQSLAKP